MPPYYYSTRQPQPSKPLQPQRNRRSFGRQVLIACIFGIVGVLTVQVVSRAIAAYTAPKPHVDTKLQTALNSWVSQQPFRSTIFVSELSGDLRTAAYGSADLMVTASTYKFYVAYATLHQVEQGSISMNTRTQTGQTVTSALSKMILQSDNSSAEALGFLVGWNNIDTLVASAGALHTHINNYDSSGNATQGDKRSTAGDLGLILGKLQDGKLLDASDTQLLLGLMKQQVWRERVPAGIPSSVQVADKPGWLPNVQNDAAIVYGPKSTYVLVVMTTSNTTQPLANLSQIIYEQLES